MYTPLLVDGEDPSIGRVFYGGVGLYLKQRSALFRKLPSFVGRLLDRPALLGWASRFAVETRPEELGEMTASVLAGDEGLQKEELERLVRFLADEMKPEIVNLANSLLAALAPAIRRDLGVPVVCTLQGEEAFVAGLPEPYRSQACTLARKHAGSVDLFIAPGAAYADEMADFLRVPRQRIQVIRPGIDPAPYERASPRVRLPFRVGFLSVLKPEKGVDVLFDAFRELERRRPGRHELRVAGQLAREARAYWADLREGLARDGLSGRFDYAGEPRRLRPRSAQGDGRAYGRRADRTARGPDGHGRRPRATVRQPRRG
jgi:glycosyltransferase involved in cell wall biosynthesis